MIHDRIRLAYCGFHPDKARSLVAEHGNAGRVLELIRRGVIAVTERVADVLRVPPAELLGALEAAGSRVVVRGEPGYPSRLAAFPDAPDVLFVTGTLPPGRHVAVVGTRRCTSYGRRVAREYGRAIGAAGMVLVSGLARGIDGAAHLGTVEASARGVAVLGSGIDVIYPPEHRDLSRRLVELGGGIVSEYPPGTPPDGFRFPLRNRIISGLSGAVVVVEAGVTGGALITAGIAAEQGVPVLATPGDIERETSWGTNLLIRDGAIPVLDGDDLLEELDLIVGPVGAVPA